jgi:hypothetical protein
MAHWTNNRLSYCPVVIMDLGVAAKQIGVVVTPNAELAMNLEPLLSDYLIEDQAATELGVCTKTLQRWRTLGEGPAITRLGRRILYRRSTVAAWIATRETHSTSNSYRYGEQR